MKHFIRKTSLLFVAVLLVIISYSQVTIKKTGVNIRGGNWSLGRENYKAVISDRTALLIVHNISFADTDNKKNCNIVSFAFKKIPAKNGSYLLDKPNADNAISIIAGAVVNGVATTYVSYVTIKPKEITQSNISPRNKGKLATVTVVENKVKVIIPTIWLYNINNPTDSLPFNASIREF